MTTSVVAAVTHQLELEANMFRTPFHQSGTDHTAHQVKTAYVYPGPALRYVTVYPFTFNPWPLPANTVHSHGNSLSKRK
jgi:hypothetical protein